MSKNASYFTVETDFRSHKCISNAMIDYCYQIFTNKIQQCCSASGEPLRHYRHFFKNTLQIILFGKNKSKTNINFLGILSANVRLEYFYWSVLSLYLGAKLNTN